jgi:uncharacterized protein (TIGR02231 family)
MRKNIISLAACVLFLVAESYAADIIADSRIAEVTIYPGSALISRLGNLKLNPGSHRIIFPDIIPEVDENSLRVSTDSAAEVKLFGAQLKKEFLKEAPSERIAQLNDELQKIQDELTGLENQKQVLLEEKDFLDSIRLFSEGQIPKDLVTRMPPAKDLEDTLKFLGAKLRENFSLAMEAELKIRELMKQQDVLKRELSQVSGPAQKLKRLIAVDLEVLKPATVGLRISYLVPGASWQPLYEARANFQESEVELVSSGIVKQNTGEDWADVEISLSTAKPAIGGRMPYVSPWFLRPYQPQRILRNRMDVGGRAGKSADISQYEAFDKLDEGKPLASSLEYAQAEEKGTAVVYKLAKKAAVKSDGSEHKLPISSQILNAKFEYSSFPRAGLYTYLGSRVTNAPGLQLLSGRVNIFLEGDFVGASSIDNIAPNEEFDLYLGIDENVKVKRELLEKKVDETLIAGIPAATKRIVFKYKLTVENYKSKKSALKLFEAMPVSEDDRIKVKINQVNLEPAKKDWKDRKGIWLWEFELEPNQKREIIYSYTIEHPREMQVEGL